MVGIAVLTLCRIRTYINRTFAWEGKILQRFGLKSAYLEIKFELTVTHERVAK